MDFEKKDSGLLVPRKGLDKGRAITRDAAFKFRMGAAVPGTVNRLHPATIEPALNDATNPLTLFGQACLANGAANSVRAILNTDGGIDAIYGISVRPFPFASPSAAAAFGQDNFGGGGPAVQNAVDILRSGYIMVILSGATAAAKGGRVWVYTANSGGGHVLGGFEAAGGANLIELDEKTTWNGPADASGFAELAFNI